MWNVKGDRRVVVWVPVLGWIIDRIVIGNRSPFRSALKVKRGFDFED
jgi:hypothetical protein